MTSAPKGSLVMVSSPSSPETTTKSDRTTELAECGWLTVTIYQPDGTMSQNEVPLTPEEFLHPQDGYHLPNSTFHDDIAAQAKDILTRRYANDPIVGVFRNVLIEWDLPGQGDHCPDTFVAFGISNKDQNRSKFIIAEEGVRPRFVLEVVSPRYRKEDRETKVLEYARTRVQEYVIIDRRPQRGEVIDEVLGYRLVEGLYQPITPDEEGHILCETVGLLIGWQEGCLLIEDASTGERLLSSAELAAANQELEATNQELKIARDSAKKQAAEMAAMLERYRERSGDLSENGEG